jgi:hypothetical protein
MSQVAHPPRLTASHPRVTVDGYVRDSYGARDSHESGGSCYSYNGCGVSHDSPKGFFEIVYDSPKGLRQQRITPGTTVYHFIFRKGRKSLAEVLRIQLIREIP